MVALQHTRVCVTATNPCGSQCACIFVGPLCDCLDFNNDGILFDPTDLEAFFSRYSGGPCIPSFRTCNDINFNNDGIEQDPTDLETFFRVYSGGTCF